MTSRRPVAADSPLTELLAAEFHAWRDRLEGGCQLEHAEPRDEEAISVRVRIYFGAPMEPAPHLIIHRSDFTSYLLREARRASDQFDGVREASALLWTNVDEEFETDHGDHRRLRRIGLRGDLLGRPVFFAEIS